MAEIDKSLPNQPEDIKLEDVNDAEASIEDQATPKEGEPEIIQTEDGGAEISFDPQPQQVESQSHFQNLAELLDDDVLDPLGSKLVNDYMDYRSSRKDWEDTYRNGLDLLGFK